MLMGGPWIHSDFFNSLSLSRSFLPSFFLFLPFFLFLFLSLPLCSLSSHPLLLVSFGGGRVHNSLGNSHFSVPRRTGKGRQVRTLASEDPSPERRLPAARRGVWGHKKHFLSVPFGPAVQQREGACLAGGFLPEPHSVTESGAGQLS